jgi:hypothetical protein
MLMAVVSGANSDPGRPSEPDAPRPASPVDAMIPLVALVVLIAGAGEGGGDELFTAIEAPAGAQ